MNEPLLIHARHGDLYAYPSDTYLGQAIWKYGEYSEREYLFLADVLDGYEHAGSDILEVGANAGYLTLPLAKHGRVVAFEPQPDVYQLLLANMNANGLLMSHRVYPVPRAVGSAVGTIDCPVYPYTMGGNHGGVPMGIQKRLPMIQVPLTTLDSEFFLPDQRLKLIKADVEGMEERVLKGARQLIARDQPLLYIENDRPDSSPSLIKCVWSLGYWCAWHCPEMFNPDNFFKKPDNAYGNMASVNMICVPEGKRLPQGLGKKHGLMMVEDAAKSPVTGI